MATAEPRTAPRRRMSLADTDWEAHMARNRRVIEMLERWRREDEAAAAAGEPPEKPLEITPLSLREVKID